MQIFQGLLPLSDKQRAMLSHAFPPGQPLCRHPPKEQQFSISCCVCLARSCNITAFICNMTFLLV